MANKGILECNVQLPDKSSRNNFVRNSINFFLGIGIIWLVSMMFISTSLAWHSKPVLGSGVTSEPCVNELGEVIGHLDRGCIYLGSLPDQSNAFSPVSIPWQEAVFRFWDRVNANGGIAGRFDVNARNFVRDSGLNPAVISQTIADWSDEVVAFASIVGAGESTEVIASQLKDEGFSASVLGFSSLHNFLKNDSGAILETGRSYCLGAMAGVDYATDVSGAQTIALIRIPGIYGDDALQGARVAAQASGLTVLWESAINPNDPFDPLTQLLALNVDPETGGQRQHPDIVFLAGTPFDVLAFMVTSAVGGAANPFTGDPIPIPGLPAPGTFPAYTGKVVIPAPAWLSLNLTNPSISVADYDRLIITDILDDWGANTVGHAAVRDAFAFNIDDPFTDPFYIFGFGPYMAAGWASQYVLLEALENALALGVLTKEVVYLVSNFNFSVDTEGMYDNFGVTPFPNLFADRTSVIKGSDHQSILNTGFPSTPTGTITLLPRSAGNTAANYRYKRACINLE